MPNRRGRVFINDRRVYDQVKLNDGDRFKVRDLTLTYFLRPLDSV